MTSPKIVFIVGPTAIGKTDIAVRLAREIKGEIVSCDAMQVYKEVSLVTNKPDGKQRKSVKHHLIDVISVKESFDVAEFNTLSLQAIKDIHQRGKIPVIVGGSGMYVKILLDGIFE